MPDITQDSNGFSRSFATTHDNEEFFFHLIQFQNKQILNISINGILDTTFKIPVSTKTSINYESMMDLAENDNGEEELSTGGGLQPEPQMTIGDYSNMKISIVAGQIGKLMSTQSPRDVILSIGSKWFGKGDEVSHDDFEKLTFVLQNVKKLL